MDSGVTVLAQAASIPDSTVFLLPGQVHASGEGSVVATVLGSCVSVCLVDRARAIGGINHFLLPCGDGHASPTSSRFGAPALQLLLDQLVALGASPRDLEAKVFGGASVLGTATRSVGEPLGQKNIAVAMTLLGREGIPVVASDVGGERGRKLMFDTQRGDAWVKLL
jgi:chemotaxis protein CheD